MSAKHNEFKIGAYRPIYLWGGPGTIRMNRLKFMDQPVDEAAHHEVHSEVGAKRVLDNMYCNYVHLMYDWGFPPEVEAEDWDDFERAAAIYHQAGDKIFAYIQTSNCVYDGSFVDKDWYALDPDGRRVYYYSGRYMACLTSPEWKQHLKDLIRGAIQRGADGVFFDNLWYGAMPTSLFDAWLGAAGCHCERCQSLFQAESGEAIPGRLDLEDQHARRYLKWRAAQLTALMKEMADFAGQLQPGAPISANDFDLFMRSAYLVYGMDLPSLAEVQDIVMIENFALPRWDAGLKPRLANNALTIRSARALIGKAAHLSVLSYDVGIGFDPLYPPRRYVAGIAEAAACGASMTTKGTEYFHQGQHTVLTPEEFAPIHAAIGRINRWLEANQDLYLDRQNVAPVGLLFPGERLWLDWFRLAPLYHGAGQALIQAGIPWRVVMPGNGESAEAFQDLQVLLAFEADNLVEIETPPGVQTIMVPEIEAWRPAGESFVARTPAVRELVARAAHSLMNAYHGSRPARRFMDSIGMPKLITQTPLFYLPSEEKRQVLMTALPERLFPRVEAQAPVLIETWRKGVETQIHLVNYAPGGQMIRLNFESPVNGKALTPDEGGNRSFSGKEVELPLDVYQVLVIKEQSDGIEME